MTDELIAFLNRSKWTYAKTYPAAPHWYINRKKLVDYQDHQLFCDLVEMIRSHGVDEKFWSKTTRYLYINDFKLWTMGGEIIRDKDAFITACALGYDDRFEGRYAEFILNIAHKDGLGPTTIVPNNHEFKLKE